MKTGAIAQYPSGRERDFSTQIFRFLDGSEQRFPGYGAPLRKWTIQLSLLDESELVNLEQFFEGQGGRAVARRLAIPLEPKAAPRGKTFMPGGKNPLPPSPKVCSWRYRTTPWRRGSWSSR